MSKTAESKISAAPPWMVVLGMLLLSPVARGNSTYDMPMPVPEKDTAVYRWLHKPVKESRLLDDMTHPSTWQDIGIGAISFDGVPFTPGGPPTLRLTSPTLPAKPDTTSGRPFAQAVARREFDRENWTSYNRLSVYIRPDLPGFKTIVMLIRLHNDGAIKVPNKYEREGLDYVLLKNDQWNHIVWEIPHLARDQVTALDFVYRTQGNEPGATKTVRYDLAKLELQKVDADYYEGWAVAPGRIAYSHTGYELSGRKKAITSTAGPRRFSVLRADSGKVVMEKPVHVVKNDLGTFRVLDFSALNQPGRYLVKYGELSTRPFAVSESVWHDTIWKVINFFYCERCGQAVPGIHGYCHGDWQCVHDGKTNIINGGWHDAGDLSQGTINTSEAAYSMLSLGQQLEQTDPQLSARLLEEARVGLRWLLKTRFGDGYRVTWAVIDYWTDNTIGTPDDTFAQAHNSPLENARCAATEALAGVILKKADPDLAAKSLAAAEDDWRFAVEKTSHPRLDPASELALASTELYRATKKQQYLDKAIEMANIIMACQQRTPPPWKPSLTGFFYTSPDKTHILHYSAKGAEQAPIVALAELCQLDPQHPDWIKWYTTVVLHAHFLQQIASANEPYEMFSAAPYDITDTDPDDPDYPAMVRNGIRLGDGKHYLRRFPVWTEHRGNCGTTLSQAKALSTAARLLRDTALADLAREQMYWTVGQNPFSKSLMYGEGHDYMPQYTAMSGNMVGSLPVGIQSQANEDVPYWPTATCYNYDEVWVHPAGRWLWLMCDLYDPALPPAAKPAARMELQTAGTGPTREVRLTISGRGRHRVKLLADNLKLEEPAERQVQLEGSPETISWHGKLAIAAPFVVVGIVDGEIHQRVWRLADR